MHRSCVSLLFRPSSLGHRRGLASSVAAFVCGACGTSHPKWAGRCGSCLAYNSLTETRPVGGSASVSPLAQSKTKLRRLRAAAESAPSPSTWVSGGAGAGDGTLPERVHVSAELAADAKHVARRQRLPIVGSTEVQRVFGGGLMPGSLTLLAGDPGIGKSTLVMQLARWLGQALANNPTTATPNVLYVSGEETPQQLRSRAERLGMVDAHNVYVYVCRWPPSLVNAQVWIGKVQWCRDHMWTNCLRAGYYGTKVTLM